MLLRRLAVALAASALSVTALSAAPALALSTQTWVSGVGDDVNPCTRTAPCKTFAGAISKTEEGGEIVALDSGGFGAVTITKAITIDARAVNGSILASLTNGINVNAGADDRVVLRGLDLTGGYTAQADPSACSPNLTNGLRIFNAGSVIIQDSRISHATNSAILATPSTSDPKVIVQNTVMRNGCGPAIKVAPTAGHTATVAVENSTISTNASGIRAEAGGTVNLTGTTLFGNGTNLDAAGGIINAADPSNHVIAQGPLVNANASSVPAMATRTWVSGVGDDANPCSRTAQCKTLAGAFAKTATGGQINLTDNASVGAVTINRPMTIDATGAHGIVASSGASAITIDVSATQDVILRDLDIIGTPGGNATCPYAPAVGVRVLGARTVHIEDSVISGFANAGIDVAPTATATRVVVNDSVISNVCGTGIRVAPGAGQSTPVLIRHSALLNDGTGVSATAGGSVWLLGTDYSGTGIATTGAGTFTTLQDFVTPPTPDPVIITPQPRAQSPVACKALPKKLRKGKPTLLLRNTCVTSGGQRVKVSLSGKAKLLKRANGKLLVKAKGKGKVTVTLSAPSTDLFLAYSKSRTYRF